MRLWESLEKTKVNKIQFLSARNEEDTVQTAKCKFDCIRREVAQNLWGFRGERHLIGRIAPGVPRVG